MTQIPGEEKGGETTALTGRAPRTVNFWGLTIASLGDSLPDVVTHWSDQSTATITSDALMTA
jgi:hypothetical protein